MSGKRKKLPAKRSRPSEDPTPTFDVTRLVNSSAAIGLASFAKTDPSSRRRGVTTPMTSSLRKVRLRDDVLCANHLIQQR